MELSAAVPIPSSTPATTPPPIAALPSRNHQAQETDTLVAKNIPFNLSDADFVTILNTFEAKPKHVRYIFDKASGGFKGMAFIKYNRDVNITAMMNALQGLDILGRKLRIELKRTPPPQEDRGGNGRMRRGAERKEKGREEESGEAQSSAGSYGSSPTSSWEPSRRRTARSVSKGGNSYIPRVPDGTKGFSSDYQGQRTTFGSPAPNMDPVSDGGLPKEHNAVLVAE